MSLFFDFDSTNNILRCRNEGTLTKTAAFDFLQQLKNYNKTLPISAVILDLSTVTSVDLSFRAVSELAALPASLTDQHCQRMVIAPASHVFGMSRMFQLLGEQTRPNMHVVRSMDEACAILGVSDLKFEPIGPPEP